MNKKIIITGLVITITIVALVIFNNVASRVDDSNLIVEARLGSFDITISGTGELFAERSVDIKAPEMIQRNQGGSHGGGGDIRLAPLRIQDLIPEGTVVRKGDYIAQLDRTEYDNNMKDDLDRVKTYETNLEMMILDSAVTLTALRDDIKNQRATVSEREMTFRNSKYESPDVLRQAEINFEQSKRILEQKLRTYELRVAQTNQSIRNTRFYLGRYTGRINDTKDLLDKFTITSPGDGMLIYKRDFRGSKRKVGTMISPFDRVIATIPDLSSMFSKTFISEIEISKIEPGLSVDITVDAFPQKSFKGKIETVANIGETLPNSDSKVFETQIRIDGSDPALRPSMTTGNKILVKSYENVVYIPTECIMTGADSVTFVYTRNRLRQVVVPGESNDKHTVIEKGLKPGTKIFLSEPQDHGKFKLAGEDLIPEIKAKARQRIIMAGRN
jgi:multidrug efflux pump subunit AcrA (membrane-fusion protein)